MATPPRRRRVGGLCHTGTSFFLHDDTGKSDPGQSDDLAPAGIPPEPRSVVVTRWLVILLVAAAAAVVGALAFTFLQSAEVKRMELAFDAVMTTFDAGVRTSLQSLADTNDDLAAELNIPPGGQVVITGLQGRTPRKLRLAKASFGVTIALVPEGQRQAFEAWAKESAEKAIASTDGPHQAVDSARTRYRTGIIRFVVATKPGGGLAVSFLPAPNGTLVSLPGLGPSLAPVLQSYPLANQSASIMVDAFSTTDRREALTRVVSMVKSGASGLTLADFLANVTRPATLFYSPTFWPNGAAGPGGASQQPPAVTVTGVTQLTFQWEVVLRMLLPEGAALAVVLESLEQKGFNFADLGGSEDVDTSRFTFEVSNSSVRSIGWGDLHARITRAATPARLQRSVRFTLGFSSFQITARLSPAWTGMVRPTAAMFDFYLTTLPRDAVIGSVALIAGVACAFALFDLLSRRRFNVLVRDTAAAQADGAAAQERMRARHGFVSMVSHEIRSPASAIVGALDLLQSTALSPPQLDFVEAIRMGSAQILSLVEDALAVGLDGTGHFSLCPQAADLRADVLERSWHAVRLQGRFAEKVDRLQMELRVAPCVPRRTAADVTRCCQVVMNLLTNAVKFAADEGGSVEMSAAYDAATETLSVAVRDNGRGLSAEGLGKLFKPFSQAEGEVTKATFGGTGLGLVICRDITRAMGGDLAVESAGIGRGCTFTATMQLPNLDSDSGGVRGRSFCGAAEPHTWSPMLVEQWAPSGHADSSSAGLLQSPASASSVSVILGGGGGGDGGWPGASAAPLRSAEFARPGSRLSAILSGALAALHQQPQPHQRRKTCNGDDREALAGASSSSRNTRSSMGDYGIHTPSPAITDSGGGGGAVTARGSRAWGAPAGLPGAPGHAGGGALIRVIAAEDDPLCRRVLKMTLRLASMDCEVVGDGLAVSELVARDPTAAALILLDSNMGGGDLDGLPTVLRLVAFFAAAGVPAPPIVVLSGDASAEARESFLAAGAARVLVKPATVEALRTLPQLVHGRAAERAAEEAR